MKRSQIIWLVPAFAAVCGLASLLSCASSDRKSSSEAPGAETAQVPEWSRQDLDFFLHGSMSTEFVPENVLRAFIRAYPDLFPTPDLRHLGLIPDPAFGWPVGFSRARVPHLGGLPAVGVNCAACHVGEVRPTADAAPVRVLGMTSQFDAEAFFGSIIVATFRTADAANMKKFLGAYLAVNDLASGAEGEKSLEARWQSEEPQIIAVIAADPAGSKDTGPEAPFNQINANDLQLDHRLVAQADLAALSHSMLRLFHNMRAALHVPDQPPEKAPPASGPGRDDAFGLLSAELFGAPQPYAPVKYGLVWNVEKRHWVHWDGNTQSPLGRNLLASLGLGAPLIGQRGYLDFPLVQRQTELSEHIHAPRYPFAIDAAAARRGAAHYEANCASCHGGSESDRRLYAAAEVGTDPNRAELFSRHQADLFDKFLAELEIPGYQPPAEPGIRSTQKYWAASMDGVWARSPYLHNGSVRTMQELLMPPAAREKLFHRGSNIYDAVEMGYADHGAYLFDTQAAGNANSGHDYGTKLPPAQKQELIEYLKTL